MNLNNQVVLLIGMVGLIVIVGGIFILTHQTQTYPSSPNGIQVATTSFATSTDSITTSTTQASKSVSPRAGGMAANSYISYLSPTVGVPGTLVTIKGSGFDKKTNYVMFGTSIGRHHVNGTADNVIATVGSNDGTTLTFLVPNMGPSGLLCDLNNQCVATSAVILHAGIYPISVQTKNDISNSVLFTLKR